MKEGWEERVRCTPIHLANMGCTSQWLKRGWRGGGGKGIDAAARKEMHRVREREMEGLAGTSMTLK